MTPANNRVLLLQVLIYCAKHPGVPSLLIYRLVPHEADSQTVSICTPWAQVVQNTQTARLMLGCQDWLL